MRIVAIANQKGGVGKTTTALNLSCCLAELGRDVLLIDLDPQANCTSGLGIDPPPDSSLYRPLLGLDNALSRVIPTRMDGLFMIPADMDLAGAEIEVARMPDHLMRLREVLEPIRESNRFEFCILDCPPSLGVLMTSALAAADELLTPLQCEWFGLEGLAKIVHLIEQIRATGANDNLRMEGVLMTMFSHTNLSQQVVDEVRHHFADEQYQTIIPRNVKLSEAPSHGKSVIEYDPSSRGAQAYRELAKEFLARRGQINRLTGRSRGAAKA